MITVSYVYFSTPAHRIFLVFFVSYRSLEFCCLVCRQHLRCTHLRRTHLCCCFCRTYAALTLTTSSYSTSITLVEQSYVRRWWKDDLFELSKLSCRTEPSTCAGSKRNTVVSRRRRGDRDVGIDRRCGCIGGIGWSRCDHTFNGLHIHSLEFILNTVD